MASVRAAWSVASDSGQPVERDVVDLVEEFRTALVRRLSPLHYELVDLELELRRQLRVTAVQPAAAAGESVAASGEGER
jgi:hypothetical protein